MKITKHALRYGWLALLTGLLCLAGCSDNDSSNPPAATPPPAPDPEINYTFVGSAVKGVISNAEVSLLDASGEQVGATTQTADNGDFQLVVTTTVALETPLTLLVRAAGIAQTVCDLQPVCMTTGTVDGETVTAAVSFGQRYDLPLDFQLRAPVEVLQEESENTFQTVIYVSPLSEFVITTALGMSTNGELVQDNIDAANARVFTLLTEIYPGLEIPEGTTVAGIGLLDLTDLANAKSENFTDLSLAMSSVAASIASFVDPSNSGRSDLVQVMTDLASQISANLAEDSVLSSNLDKVLLARSSVSAVNTATATIDQLIRDGTVQLPTGISLDDFLQLEAGGLSSLPQIIDIWTNLVPGESTSPVMSNAAGWADLIFLPETGEASVNLETDDIDATAVHLHGGYAGTNGGVLIGLVRDPGNDNRWQLPTGTVLDADMIAAIMQGGTYFNVHSEAYPGGELRGQVLSANIMMALSTLSGFEQTPVPVDGAGFARAAVTVNLDDNTAQVHMTTTGIESLAVHLHQNIAGRNGQVVIPLEQDILSDGHWFAGPVTLEDELLTALLSAQLYFNVHSAAYPAGEIRAQVIPMGYLVRFSVLNSSQVVSDEPVESAHTGMSAVTLDQLTGNFSIHVNTSDIEAPLAMHIHNAAAGLNGGIVFELSRDPLEANHWFLEGAVLTEEQYMMFTNNEFYVNVHTADFNAGEIRGQLIDVLLGLDTDADGVPDTEDAFLNDPTESVDSDADGVGDNADAFPMDASETTDTDGDGVGDNADQCPEDPSGSVDSDNDGICDASEPDTDGDGVPDDADAFPNDPDETVDTDGDGVGDNADVFPTDPNETADADNDGVGDASDNCPDTSNSGQEDADGNGIGDACDTASAPTLADVQAIFNTRCVVCHGIGGTAGLSLIEANAFNELVGVASSEVATLNRVEAGDAEMSYLVWKIEGRAGIAGSRMPLGGVLPDADIQTIRDWIDAGALP